MNSKLLASLLVAVVVLLAANLAATMNLTGTIRAQEEEIEHATPEEEAGSQARIEGLQEVLAASLGIRQHEELKYVVSSDDPAALEARILAADIRSDAEWDALTWEEVEQRAERIRRMDQGHLHDQ